MSGTARCAWAAPVACTPTGSNQIAVSGVVTSATYTCFPNPLANNMPGDGLNVQAIQLFMTVSMQSIGVPVGQTQALTAVMTNSAGFNNPAAFTVSGVAPVGGTFSTTGTCPAALTAIACVDVVSAFNVTVTGVPSGPTVPFSATADVFYDTIPCGVVPEPSSLALVGAAAVVLARRAARSRR